MSAKNSSSLTTGMWEPGVNRPCLILLVSAMDLIFAVVKPTLGIKERVALRRGAVSADCRARRAHLVNQGFSRSRLTPASTCAEYFWLRVRKLGDAPRSRRPEFLRNGGLNGLRSPPSCAHTRMAGPDAPNGNFLRGENLQTAAV